MKTAADLDKIFSEAEAIDKREFSRMRSSLKLIAGDHYHRESNGFGYIRSSKELTGDTKLRLTKNHMGRIARRYANSIATAAPGVQVNPKHERELQDQKAADLNQSVWVDIKEKNDFPSFVAESIDDFCGLGEVGAKLFFDTFKRVVKFEPILGFNLLRDPSAKNIKQSPYYIIRKMVQTKDLKSNFPEHAEKIKETNDETFLVFHEGEYRMNTKNETLLREFYFRPCAEYPKGYYFIQTPGLILDHGELPGGIFPLVVERFEYVQTKCRGISVTDPLRPYQLEINRTASKIAEHQITLGDDKLILQNGAKMSAGVQLPGIRGITVSGPAPIIMEGRSGSQYIEYMLSQIKEMYQVAEMVEEEELQANLEPHTLLYRAASEKRKFSRYVKRFEGFLKQLCTTSLELARLYYNDEDVVMAVGQNERVNIAEFKNTSPLALQIVVEAQAEDVESKLGRQLVMTNILQYVGSSLDKSSIGKLIKQLPYANIDESFSDLTIDYEVATNNILALDRGELPQIFPFENHNYIVSRLSKRMTEPDFRFLHPYIQGNYEAQIDERMGLMKAQKEALQREAAGFIPDGGALIGVDYYVTDANNPDRTRRARIPYAAVDWLVRKLEEQGTFKQQALQIPEQVLAEQALSDIPQAQGASAEIVNPALTGPV
jgi:hypothetical protein